MTYIAQNKSESIALSAGQWIEVTGTGIATQIAGPTKGQAQTITNTGKVGPFDYAQTISLTATGSPIYFSVVQDYDDAKVLVNDSGVPFGVGSVNGETAAVGLASRPVIAFFGDSFFQQGNYGWIVPWGRDTVVGSINGVGFVGMERKAASGAHSLSYDAATRTCSFDSGPATLLVDGFQVIPGATSLTGCGITVRTEALPTSNQTTTWNRAGSRPDELVDSKSIAWWMNVFANQGYSTRMYGHGGGQIRDGLSIVRRSTAFDGFAINYHTNDIAGLRTLAQMQADMIQLLDQAYSKSRSKIGVVFGGCTYRTGFSTAQAEIMDAFNRWLPEALKDYPGVVARFPWQRLVNDAGTGANTLMMNADNVHDSDPAAQYAGKDLFDYFDRVLPGTPWDFGSALGRWSATNLSGNLISNPNPSGNNSGQPTNWGTLTKGDAGATPTKVPRTDGVAGDWARITSSSSVDNIANSYTIPTSQFPDPPAAGTVLQAFVEVRVSGAGQMVPLLLLTELKNGSVVAWSRVNSSSDLKSLQMTEWVGVIATPPYVWSDTAGTPTIDIRIGQRLNNGASSAVLDIGRVWVGTPEESSIY
jgi:hypothetical protein